MNRQRHANVIRRIAQNNLIDNARYEIPIEHVMLKHFKVKVFAVNNYLGYIQVFHFTLRNNQMVVFAESS